MRGHDHQQDGDGDEDDAFGHADYSSRRYSPKSHSAVKKTTSKTARKAIPFPLTIGSRSNRPTVTVALTTSTGVSSGSKSNGRRSSRMRACAGRAESAVPAMEVPRLPRHTRRRNQRN